MGVLSSPQACKEITKMMKNALSLPCACSPPPLWPSLRLMPDTDTATTLDMATTDTMAILMLMDTDMATTSTARDPPMLSPPLSLKPMLMLTTDTVILDMLTTDTTATTTARDPLMLRPPPLPSPDMDILDMLITDITAILMPTVVTTDTAIIINLFDYLLRVEDC